MRRWLHRRRRPTAAPSPNSPWLLLAEWKLMHARELTRRRSTLLDAIALETLGRGKARARIAVARLTELTGWDGGTYRQVRRELEALGLRVELPKDGEHAYTLFDITPLLDAAVRAKSETGGATALGLEGRPEGQGALAPFNTKTRGTGSSSPSRSYLAVPSAGGIR